MLLKTFVNEVYWVNWSFRGCVVNIVFPKGPSTLDKKQKRLVIMNTLESFTSGSHGRLWIWVEVGVVFANNSVFDDGGCVIWTSCEYLVTLTFTTPNNVRVFHNTTSANKVSWRKPWMLMEISISTKICSFKSNSYSNYFILYTLQGIRKYSDLSLKRFNSC